MKQTILRIIILFAGLVVAHLGVSLFLLADLGSDPFNVMIQGLSCFLLIGWILGGAVGIGTIICLFLVGPVAGFFLPHSQKMVENMVIPSVSAT